MPLHEDHFQAGSSSECDSKVPGVQNGGAVQHTSGTLKLLDINIEIKPVGFQNANQMLNIN